MQDRVVKPLQETHSHYHYHHHIQQGRLTNAHNSLLFHKATADCSGMIVTITHSRAGEQ